MSAKTAAKAYAKCITESFKAIIVVLVKKEEAGQKLMQFHLFSLWFVAYSQLGYLQVLIHTIFTVRACLVSRTIHVFGF